MKNNIASKIIIAVIVVIICIPIISDMVASATLSTIKYDELSDTVSGTQSSYGFALVYVGNSDDSDTKTTKKDIKTMIEGYQDNLTGTSVDAYYMDSKDLTSSELEDIFGETGITGGYIFISNGEIIRTEDDTISSDLLDELTSEYSMNGISEDITYYKVAEDAETYEKLVNKKKTITMAVFGRDNCFYCNQFKAVYNTVAEEYNLDIYYFDSLSYDEDEYQKIMDLGLKIPASCTDGDEDALLSDGFSTPVTLFTKNGKVIDCISGYTNKATLITKLETVGMIKSED